MAKAHVSDGKHDPLARAPLALLAAAVVATLLAGSGGYGYHRDELYFLAAGEHLAWGYADQGPLTPAVAAMMNAIAPDSLTALRLPPALAIGAMVLLTGAIARELGAGRRAQLIAAGSVAVGSIFLITGHLLSTTTFDLLAWTALTLIAVRAIGRGDDRLWLAFGAIAGLALLNKPLVAFLAAGMIAGVAVAGPRRLLASPWVWAGGALALALWSPWLIWQADHGWPQLDVASSIAAGGSVSSESRWAFLPFQFLLVSPLLAPIWVAGLWRLMRGRELRDWRFIGVAWFVLVAVFFATEGKPYYLAGLFAVLLGAGAIAVDRWLDRGRTGARRSGLAAAFVASAIVSAALALPILPADRLGPVLAANEDVGETVGWPELVADVAGVHDELAHEAAIVTANYGQAGAIDRYGPELGLPPAFSVHNGYWEWGPPSDDAAALIAVGLPAETVHAAFRGCAVEARVGNEAGVENTEAGTPVWLCERTRALWGELWPGLRRLG